MVTCLVVWSYRGGVGWIAQLIRGAAAAGITGGGLFALTLVVGLSTGANRLLFVVVAVAGMVFGLIEPDGSRIAVAGALLGSGLALVGGLASGFGWLEVSGALGGVMAAAFLIVRPLKGFSSMTVAPWLVGSVILGAVLVPLVPLVLGGETLGHDESAYALKARSWVEGTPDTGWSPHRAPALSAYGYGVLALGGAEQGLRAIGLVSLAGLALATWWLGFRIGGRWVGPVAAAVVIAGPTIQRRGTEFLTDIPAAGLLVLIMILLWRDFENRKGPTYSILLVLPFAWLAFYLRYQSVLALGLIGLTIAILWWRQIVSRPGPVVAAVIVGFVGLIPHFLYALEETGSAIGILTLTSRAAGREFLGEGLVDYAALLVWPLAGLLGGVIVVFFIWWVVASWPSSDQRRRGLFLLIPALGQVVALGVVSHGEARFVFFPLALAAIGGVIGALHVSERWSENVAFGARLALMVLLVGSVALSVTTTRRAVQNRILTNEPVELSADVIKAVSDDLDCGVLTSYTPQLTFYSGCATDIFRDWLEPDAAVERLVGGSKFMVLIEDGKRQPDGKALDALVDLTEKGPVSIEGERDSAEVYLFEE